MIDYFSAYNLLIDYSCRHLKKKHYFIKIEDSFNMVLNENIIFNINLPSFNNSAVDGFALNVSNGIFLEKEKSFSVLGRLSAGDMFLKDFNYVKDSSFEIMTGAALPVVYNSVVKIEDVVVSNNKIFLKKDIKIWENVRKIGEDYKKNVLMLRRGNILSVSDIMALSSIGKENVSVKKKPKIYLISTGNELINTNTSIHSHYIYDSTSKALITFLKNLGLDVFYLGVVNDSVNDINILLENILKKDDLSLIITTGAVSKGKADFIPEFLKLIGANIIFHGVKIKPGKPILFSKFGNQIYFFCLPGNPVASIVGIRFFVYPFIRSILGLGLEKPIKAKLYNNFILCDKFSLFLKAILFLKKNIFYVKVLSEQESFKISGCVNSNSFIYLDNEKKKYFKNDLLDVYLFNPDRFLL